jgi:hypothetical protein
MELWKWNSCPMRLQVSGQLHTPAALSPGKDWVGRKTSLHVAAVRKVLSQEELELVEPTAQFRLAGIIGCTRRFLNCSLTVATRVVISVS